MAKSVAKSKEKSKVTAKAKTTASKKRIVTDSDSSMLFRGEMCFLAIYFSIT